jgi:hypothetical protein
MVKLFFLSEKNTCVHKKETIKTAIHWFHDGWIGKGISGWSDKQVTMLYMEMSEDNDEADDCDCREVDYTGWKKLVILSFKFMGIEADEII